MAKKPTVSTIASGYYSTTMLNGNFTALRDAFDNTLSRDGSTPNTMSADIDLNNNNLLNVNLLNGEDVSSLTGNITTVAALADEIEDVVAISDDITTVADNSADITIVADNISDVTNFADVYLGDAAADPTTRTDGSALQAGDLYFNTVSDDLKVYNGATWQVSVISTDDFLTKANNLSDLPSVSTARTNLGLGTFAVEDLNSLSSDIIPDADGTVSIGSDTLRLNNVYTDNINGSPVGSISTVPVQQGRLKVDYGSTTSIVVYCPPKLVMSGFRFMGNWMKPEGRALNSGATSYKTVLDVDDNLGAETDTTNQNWYALFAGANSADSTSTFKFMPFLRTKSVSTNTVTLAYAGEFDTPPLATQTYTFTTNGLAGCEVLIITEDKVFSGRTTTVTANTTTTVTLADASGLAEGDFFLVAPPGFSEYCYLTTFYSDTADGEARNIADDGITVNTYQNALPSSEFPTGTQLVNEEIDFRGAIAPLATGVIFQESFSYGTGQAVGAYGTTWAHDGAQHVSGSFYVNYTDQSVGQSWTSQPMCYTFSKAQYLFAYTYGPSAANRSGGQVFILGWRET